MVPSASSPMKRTKPNQRLTFARNDHYWGGRTKLDGIDFLFLDYGDPANMTGYEQGEFDITWLPEATVARDRGRSRSQPGAHQPFPIPGTIYWDFNQKREPFTDKKVREAFAYGFDREGYCRQIVLGACTPTLSWIAPGRARRDRHQCLRFRPCQGAGGIGGLLLRRPREPAGDRLVCVRREPDRGALWAVDLRAVSPGARRRADPGFAAGGRNTTPFMMITTIWRPGRNSMRSAWWGSADPSTWFVVWRCGSELNTRATAIPSLMCS